MFGLVVAMSGALYACGSTDSDSSSKETTESESGDTTSVTDASGDAVALTKESNYMLAGNYVCGADGSVWVFDGDEGVLSVAYLDTDGELGCYMCTTSFYRTDEDEDGEAHLVLAIINKSVGTVTYWYTTNLVNTDEDILGIQLESVTEADTTLTLYTQSYYEELKEAAESGDASAE